MFRQFPFAAILLLALLAVPAVYADSGSGRGYASSATIPAGCAGRPMQLEVNLYGTGAGPATAEIYFISDSGNSKVFSEGASNSATLTFTPPQPGIYQLRISLGTDQTTLDFAVPECSPATIKESQAPSVGLEQKRELVLQKLIGYPGGFSKEFSVYRISASQGAAYQTDIVLSYRNSGKAQKVTIEDSVPSSIVSSTGQIAFDSYPDGVSPGQPMVFDWKDRQVDAGGQLRFSYSIGRQLSSQMMEGMGTPKAIASQGGAAPGPSGSAPQSSGEGIVASLFSLGSGISLPLPILLLAAALLFLVYTFVFRKEEE